MLQTAFTLLGTGVTWLEALAFCFALACVICTIFEVHWGWPLLIVSSVLYGWLFYANRLYGDVALQVYFAGSSLWGWWEWLFGRRRAGARAVESPGLVVTRLTGRARWRLAVLWLALWPLIGAALARYTDTDVAYFNGFSTAGSFIAQALMGLKFIECWPFWLVVDLASALLYASKELWLTALLSLIFISLAGLGWARWRASEDLAR